LHLFLFFLFFLFGQEPSSTQEPPKPNPSADSSDVNNRHVRTQRYALAPQQSVDLPKLANESLFICLRGQSLKRVPEKGPAEVLDGGPGSAITNRGGISYRIENLGGTPAEFLIIELKDFYAFGQISAPWSELDPAYVDARHFRVVLDNPHVSVLRLHLAARDSAEQSQFTARLEIPLGPVRFSKTDTEGKSVERQHDAGTVQWEKATLETIANISSDPLDAVIVELKHPFCYPPPNVTRDGEDEKDESMKAYVASIKVNIAKKWVKKMPRDAVDGDKGLVIVAFRVLRDGALDEDTIHFSRLFAKNSLAEKALTAVRQAGPFAPFPAGFEKPFVDLHFVFEYNLPPARPAGCE
jgi:hypothetical protein